MKRQEHTNKAVIYARYSSDSQRDESIEQQISECRSYAEAKNITILDTYCDHALSGTSDKRPGFRKMIKDSESELFDYVICYKTDRFARSRADAAKYKNVLKEHGVKVLYAKMEMPEGPAGIILEGVMETLDEYYSANLSQNIKRGQFGNAKKCKSNGVNVFGYDRDENDQYVINERNAAAVKMVFKMVSEGRSNKEIREWLDNNNYVNTRGKRFGKSSIIRMITNRKYIGEYSYGDVVIENGIPVIIDKELFLSANSRLRGRRHDMSKNEEYILSGILFCGECGSAMHGMQGTSQTGKKHNYYTCNGRVKKICTKSNVNKTALEDEIVNILNGFVFNDDVLTDIAEAVVEYQKESLKSSELGYLEARYKDISKSIDNISKAIENGAISDTLINRMNALEKEKSQVEDEIIMLRLENQPLEADFVKFILQKYKTRVNDSLEKKKRLIRTFVNSIYLFEDGRIVLTYNYTKNGKLATYEDVLSCMTNKSSVRQISFGGDINRLNEQILDIFILEDNLLYFFQ